MSKWLGWMGLLALFALASMGHAHEGALDDHAEEDAIAAQAAADVPAFQITPAMINAVAADGRALLGEWGDIMSWPHVPVSAANLPDGRILTFASNRRDAFPDGPEYTFAATWNPVSNTIEDIPHTTHDMFCGHLVLLEDGKLFVNGGRAHVRTTSLFDYRTNQWQVIDPMRNGRWYPTSVAMPDGRVLTALGSSGGRYPEIWEQDFGWKMLTGIDLQNPVLRYTGYYEYNWFPYLSVTPQGDLLHYGPTPQMHRLDPNGADGAGSLTALGALGIDWYPKDGASVLYDEGKLLLAGGAIAGNNGDSTNQAVVIDMTDGGAQVRATNPMHFSRKFHNAVVLPDGNVLMVGGNGGQKFDDADSVLPAEIWNREDETWQVLASMSVPRNYHSVALLMMDGRVWSAGGGLCGNCNANHQDAQVYSPPYLFNADGSEAARPLINSIPASIVPGKKFRVDASPGITRFTALKMGATTHAVNTDQRFVEFTFETLGSGEYRLHANANPNVLTPGYYMLFALDGNGVPSIAAALNVQNVRIVLNHPGSQKSQAGETIELPLSAQHPLDQPMTFSAQQLPLGLVLDSDTGVISGTLLEHEEGIHDTSVTVTDGVIQTRIQFAWEVVGEHVASGRLLQEVWQEVAGARVSDLTGSAKFADSAPTTVAYLNEFRAPANAGRNFGERVSGYLFPPVSGYYQFWIAADEQADLYLGTDYTRASRRLIAQVPAPTDPLQWNRFPQQQSVLIYLVANQRYYIEALHKEGLYNDHLAVAWKIPGLQRAVIGAPYLAERSTGAIRHERWNNIAGNRVSDLLSADGFPAQPSSSGILGGLNLPVNSANDYGSRLQGYLYPPVSGDYRFWIAGNDAAELYLSTDFDANNKKLIAEVPTGTNPLQWNLHPQQKSALVQLQKGQRYYIEVLHKEGAGNDNLSVSWQIPGKAQALIKGEYLAPLETNVPPRIELVAQQPLVQGESVSFNVPVTDSAPRPLTFSATGLPPGLVLDAQTGRISGRVASAGNYQAAITVRDVAGNSTTSPLILTVTPPSPKGFRYLLLVADSEVNGNPWTSIAELNLYDPLDQPLPRDGWQLTADSEEANGGVLNNLRDGKPATYWHTAFRNSNPVHPHTLQIDLGAPAYIKTLEYLPRQDKADGRIGAYRVFVSNDGLNWNAPVAQGTFSNNIAAQRVELNTQLPLNVTLNSSGPQLAGSSVPFAVSVRGEQPDNVQWDFGDGSPVLAGRALTSVQHVYAEPGRYLVTVAVSRGDSSSTATSAQVVHNPIVNATPAVSMSIQYEKRITGNDRIWNLNPDNDSVTVFDAVTHARLAEINVGAHPRSLTLTPAGEAWITAQDAAAITIIDTGKLNPKATIALPPGSQPFGIVTDGTSAFVTLAASGELVEINLASRAVTRTLALGESIRHLALSATGDQLLVSRFITPPLPGENTASVQTQGAGGEVFVVNKAAFTLQQSALLQHSNRTDAENSGRGIPNYLASVAVSPDGTAVWIPSKQDNIRRGQLRDGRQLTHDNTVRAIVSKLELQAGTFTENPAARVDSDDSGVASAALFDATGVYLFVALESSREVALINAMTGEELRRISVGRAPQSLALAADGRRLYVRNFMDRSVTVLDVSAVLAGNGNVERLADLASVTIEKLAPDVLAGKQFFYDALDPRIAAQRYISCASCHHDGGHDGRVWDFTGFGEGLRNTTDLRGRRGIGHGPLHWSGNFDEVQDFEGQIRTLANGTGLMTNAQFNTGSVHAPLGDLKAGINSQLDALSAYVTSLNVSAPSPDRGGDGALTASAQAGKILFAQAGCNRCHAGADFTDSVLDQRHDVGTLKAASGNRLGAALTGIDTPTLKGVWSGAPYLHDGSAPDLATAIAAHPDADFSSSQMTQLVDYVRQIDEREGAPAPLAGNRAPVMVQPPNLQHGVNQNVRYALTVSDPDGDAPLFRAEGLPPGLAIEPRSGLIMGIPKLKGAFTPTITALDDKGGEARLKMNWQIADAGLCDASSNLAANLTLQGVAAQSSQHTEEVYNPRPAYQFWNLFWDYYVTRPVHLPAEAIDGNPATYSQTAAAQTGSQNWSLRFARNQYITGVVLHNRQDAQQQRLRDITVTLTNAAGRVVYTSPLLNPENMLAGPEQLPLALNYPVLASRVTVSRTADMDLSGGDEATILALAEAEVQGCKGP